MIRFCRLAHTSTMIKLYKPFVLPHFQYCSVVWHFSTSRNSEKLESFNTLRVVFNDRESTYSHLLDRAAATSLDNLRVQNMLITIHKCIHINSYPTYLKDLLTLCSTVYSLGRTDIASFHVQTYSKIYNCLSFRGFSLIRSKTVNLQEFGILQCFSTTEFFVLQQGTFEFPSFYIELLKWLPKKAVVCVRK